MARQEFDDEIGERMRVLVDAVERLLLVAAAQVPEARAGRVDEHQIAHVDQAVFVVDHPIGGGGAVRVVGGPHALRPERTHVQPDGRGAGAAVVQEGDGPLRIFLVAAEISDVGHARLRPAAAAGAVLLARRRRIVVHRILEVNHHHARLGLIGDAGLATVIDPWVV